MVLGSAFGITNFGTPGGLFKLERFLKFNLYIHYVQIKNFNFYLSYFS